MVNGGKGGSQDKLTRVGLSVPHSAFAAGLGVRLGGSDGKEFTCQCKRYKRHCLIPGSGRYLGGGHGNALQYSCLENPHGQRSLVGYSPWDRRESDTMEATYCALTHRGETTVFSVSVFLG